MSMLAPATVPLLIISGSMGAGKTTALSEASDSLSQASVEDFTVNNGPGRLVGEVASEVLSLAGWL